MDEDPAVAQWRAAEVAWLEQLLLLTTPPSTGRVHTLDITLIARRQDLDR